MDKRVRKELGPQAIDKLCHYVEAHHFSGYDPYDALNSPVLRFLSFGRKYGRIAWIQFMRRFPWNLRSLLLVKKGHNPKGIGLFLWGYAKLYRLEPRQHYLDRIDELLGLLETLKSPECSGNGWGYNFDWQSRAFFVPAGTPTIVNSSFIGHALLDVFRYAGRERALELALPIRDFLLNDLHRTVEGDTFCFSYTPIDRIAVHNANLLGASLLIRLHGITGDEESREAALAALAYSMKYQHADGSWYYAETEMQSWIDSFHTGFNLQAIRFFLECGEGGQYREGYQKGVRFYADNFFMEDGTPKYYHDRVYPIDIHSPAQAVVFFSGEGEEYAELTGKVYRWMLKNMYDAQGFFYFRKGKFLTNKIPYIRWSQSWAFHALTEYFLHQD